MSSQDDQLLELPEDDPDPVVPVAVGEVVNGKYRIGRIIGFGGMATVASGHHLELDQPIAIKFLRGEQTARPDAVRRFLSEARAAAKLDSPHVARVLDVGSAELARGGVVPFMVMELLEGRDLDALLTERGRLPVDEAVEYILQACAGVAEAHAKGIIHRDLKPGNLFLTRRRDGTPLVKLLDFGISKTVSRGTGKRATELTGDSELMGSPRYMSPEQTRSAKDVDARSDIWALGIILYELLTGVAPFDCENVADTLVSILQTEAKPIATLAPDVPAGLVLIVTRCLQKKAGDRFASVEDLAAALAPYRSATPVVIPPMILRHDDLPSSEAGVSVQTVRAAMPRSRVLVTALVAAAAVAIVAVGVLALGRLRARADADAHALATTSAVSAPPSAEEPAPVLAASAAAVAPAPVESAAAATGPNAADAVPSLPTKNVKAGGPRTKAPRGAGSAPRSRTDW